MQPNTPIPSTGFSADYGYNAKGGGFVMHANIKYKDTVFRRLFGEIPKFAELYRAVGGEIKDESTISAVDLNDAFFYAFRNDLAFKVDNRLIVFAEHRSTPNPNMPFRMMIYFIKTVLQVFEPKALYRSKALKLQAAEFYVFYEGRSKTPEILGLSDLTEIRMAHKNKPFLCSNVRVIDIKYARRARILKRCRTLKEYSWFNERVEHYQNKGEDRKNAIRLAVGDCRKRDFLTEFLDRYGTEVTEMMFLSYDHKTAMEVAKEEGIGIGREEEKAEIARMMKKNGIHEEEIAKYTKLSPEKIREL